MIDAVLFMQPSTINTMGIVIVRGVLDNVGKG